MRHRLLPPPREEWDAMIARAEAACLRYRQGAGERGLSPAVLHNRRMKLVTMEAMLARLLAQREAAA
jgi:hypothetical protein